MCGIVLTVNADSKFNTRMGPFLSDALLASQVRGTHATGLMQLDNRGVDVYKKATNASNFMEDSRAKSMVQFAGNQTFTVAHVRHATVGDKGKDVNAHPFVIERADGSSLIGVHNGSLNSWRHKNDEDFEVDSNWALHRISEKGLDAFEEFSGAYCFVWYDTLQPDNLNICRQKDRPFHLFVDEKNKSIYGASEAGMLEWLLERKDICQPEDQSIMVLEPHKLYTIDLVTLSITVTDAPTYIAPPVTVYDNRNYSAYNYGRSYGNTGWNLYDFDDSLDVYDLPDDGWKKAREHEKQYYAKLTEANLKRIGDALNPPPVKVEAPAKPMLSLVPYEEGVTKVPANNEDMEAAVWSLACNTIQAQNISASTVTYKQIELAKSMQCYGQLVCWEPVLFDDTDPMGALLGDVHYMNNDIRDKIEGRLGFIQKTRAMNDFLNTATTVFPMMIVGADVDNAGDVYLLLGELNAMDRKLLFTVPRSTELLPA